MVRKLKELFLKSLGAPELEADSKSSDLEFDPEVSKNFTWIIFVAKTMPMECPAQRKQLYCIKSHFQGMA